MFEISFTKLLYEFIFKNIYSNTTGFITVFGYEIIRIFALFLYPPLIKIEDNKMIAPPPYIITEQLLQIRRNKLYLSGWQGVSYEKQKTFFEGGITITVTANL
jgi:hypothetical protein